MANLLPLPVILALLRILRHKPPQEDDEDVLFDILGVLGGDQVLATAAAMFLDGDGTQRGVDVRDRALDALLVDMLREHKRNRDRCRDREMETDWV